MNILFVSSVSAYASERFGGAEASMRLLAEQLAKRGHRIIYITKHRKPGVFPVLTKNNIDGVQLFAFRNIKGDGRLKAIRVLNDLLFKYYVMRVIHNYGVQLVYCMYELEMLKLLLKLRNSDLEFKIVMRMAGMYWYEACLKSPDDLAAFEYIFNRIDAVNYVTPTLKPMVEKKLRELGMNVSFRYEFTADIGSRVKPGRSKSYDKNNNDEFTIVMASRFSDYQKRQDIIVRALSLLRSDVRVCLKLIGDGKQREYIQELINHLNINHRVAILPFLAQEELWNELLKADLLCHACDYEGTSKIILESMALGLPVLASNVDPINNYVLDGINGFVVDNGPQLWAEKIEMLIDNLPLRAEVSVNAMNYVKSEHNPVENVNNFEDYFYEITTSGNV